MPGARPMMSSIMAHAAPKPKSHIKCRAQMYPRDNVKRFPVPDDKVSWTVAFPEYQPVNHTSPSVLAKPVWADPDFRFVFGVWHVYVVLCVHQKWYNKNV